MLGWSRTLKQNHPQMVEKHDAASATSLGTRGSAALPGCSTGKKPGGEDEGTTAKEQKHDIVG